MLYRVPQAIRLLFQAGKQSTGALLPHGKPCLTCHPKRYWSFIPTGPLVAIIHGMPGRGKTPGKPAELSLEPFQAGVGVFFYLCAYPNMRKTGHLDPNATDQLKSWLTDKDSQIGIVTHVNPDGDAMGSALGLYNWLLNAGYSHVWAMVPNAAPGFLHWMPGHGQVLDASAKPVLAAQQMASATLLFCVDFNGPGRTGKLEQEVRASTARKVLIDHHPQPEEGFDLVFSQTEVSSTAEILYGLMHDLGGSLHLDKAVAECLYTGILTDTGSFSFACNRPQTYEITARLIATGVDAAQVHQRIYSTYSANRMRLLGYCLSEKLRVLEAERTAYISLSRQDLKRFRHRPGDTEGIVNYAMSIAHIDLAALFIENKDHIRVSFRSAGQVDVNRFARRFFNGGGHVNASGGTVYKSLEETLAYFESIIKEGGKHE